MILGVLVPILVSAIYCLGVVSLGLCGLALVGLRRTRWRDAPLSLYLGTAFALGSGLAATFWLTAGFFGLFTWASVLAGLVAFTLLSLLLNSSMGLRTAMLSLTRELLAETLSWRVIALGLVFVILMHGVSTLHPALGDSVAFYLPWARLMADSGRVIPVPAGYESFSDIWTVAEIQTAAIMMVAGDFAARPLPFWHAVATAFLLWGAARAASLGLRGCILIVAMLFTTSAVTLIVWDGKTDLVAMPLGVAALITAVVKEDGLAKRQSLLTGLLAGASVAAKLSYLPIVAAGLLAASTWHLWLKVGPEKRGWWRGLREEATSLAIAGIAAAAILAPQMARNWIASGEPFAPIYYFHGVSFGLEQDWFSPATTRRILFSYPIALTFGNYWGQHGNTSVLALMFLPLCLVYARAQSRTFWLLTGVAFAGLSVWVLLRTSTLAPRYILCSLVLLYVFHAGIAAKASHDAPALVRAAIVGVTGYALLATFSGLVPKAAKAADYARVGDVEAYERDEAFPAGRLLNRVAAPGARVALLNHYRYPMRADLVACAIGAPEATPPGGTESLDSYYVKGARYLMADFWTHKLAIEKLLADAPTWLSLKKIFDGSRVVVWELEAKPGAPAVEIECKREDRLWRRVRVR